VAGGDRRYGVELTWHIALAPAAGPGTPQPQATGRPFNVAVAAPGGSRTAMPSTSRPPTRMADVGRVSSLTPSLRASNASLYHAVNSLFACVPVVLAILAARGMAKPFLLIQLSDPHIGATWADGDPVAGLRAAVEAVRRLPDDPDAVLMSGDLADNAADGEYDVVRELLSQLGAPAYVLPGNHDDREALRRHFDLPGAGGTPVQYAVDLGPLRLVALDSTRPGEDRGELDVDRLAWLDAELALAPDRATLLALHHPPVSTGILAWDEIGLPAEDRRGLGQVLQRHPQVRRVVAGHVHRTIAAELAGRAVLAVPSTYVQARLSFTSDEIEVVAEPPGFAVHAVLDGELASHVQPVS
jgi:3',5'-cyclic-AMP phosphodiesterase